MLFIGFVVKSIGSESTSTVGESIEAATEIVWEDDGVESLEMVEESDKTAKESVADEEYVEICTFANDSGLKTPRNELGCRNRCTRMYRNERDMELMKLKPRILSGNNVHGCLSV